MEENTEKTEMVTIVDEDNQIIGAATRKEMREKKLISRATYIFVSTSDNKFIIQRRAKFKKWCPQYIDLSFGGCVQKDQSYEENALIEMEEEIGAKGIKLEPLFEFKFGNELGKLWGKVFTCVYDGEIKKQYEEVEEVYRYTLQEIQEIIKNGEKVTPDSLHAFQEFLKFKKIEFAIK